MIYTCRVCNRLLVTRADEATEDGYFPPIVSYAVAIKEDENAAYACADCVLDHSGRGKFEAAGSTRGDIGKALILYACSMDGMEDDRMYQEGWGYCAIIGRFLLMEDDRGFVTFEEFESDDKAWEKFDRYYSSGWGAQDDDAYISDERGGYSVSFNGKYIGTFERYNRARAAVSLEMRKSGFYPSVWHVEERGDISNVSVW